VTDQTPSTRAGLRDEIAAALEAADYSGSMRRGDLADAILPVLYRAWPWLRAEADAGGLTDPEARTQLQAVIKALGASEMENKTLRDALARCPHREPRKRAEEAVAGLAQALRLTREYVGADLLPAVKGWDWYDALRRWAPHELGEHEQQAEPLVHVGGNAEDCPACAGTNPDYPFICPGPDKGADDSDGTGGSETDAELHARRAHPDWEYRTTTGPRKQWHDVDLPPHDDMGEPGPGWERNLDAGRPGEGWDRFDYTEESYWRRPKNVSAPDPSDLTGYLAPDPPIGCLAVTAVPAPAGLREQLHAAIESEMYEYRERTMFWEEGGITTEIARLATRGAMEVRDQEMETLRATLAAITAEAARRGVISIDGIRNITKERP
jgi:hypothetical protein